MTILNGALCGIFQHEYDCVFCFRDTTVTRGGDWRRCPPLDSPTNNNFKITLLYRVLIDPLAHRACTTAV